VSAFFLEKTSGDACNNAPEILTPPIDFVCYKNYNKFNMKYLLFAVALFTSTVACNNGTGDSSASQAPTVGQVQAENKAPVVRKNILFFGNSLTAAYQLPPEKGFTALIQHKIDSLRLPYTCINAGLSGETTADGVSRIDWVLEQHVDVFVLELGGNDALRGLPLAETKKNLQTILDRVRAKYPDCRIVIAGMMAPPNLGDYATDFRKIFPALAKANRAALIPFLLEGVGGDPALNLPDGIHPNETGQKIVAETVWKTLQPVL
jgi:acyl-CoA thioesterase-1